MKPKIYIASKARHRVEWRRFREAGHNIISRWIDTPDQLIDTSRDPGLDYVKLWTHCIEDVLNCDVLILYCGPGETMKGALVELGAAIGHNKTILVVGYPKDIHENGTWISHPLVMDFTHFRINEVFQWVHEYGERTHDGR